MEAPIKNSFLIKQNEVEEGDSVVEVVRMNNVND